MENSFNCPCCQSNDWCTVQQCHYKNQPNESIENNYHKYILSLRHQVLFNVWFPNQSKVVLTAIYCKICGFMCYSPRPNQKDLEAKYQYIIARKNIGPLPNHSPRALKLDQKRASFMKDTIAKHHSIESQKVLDVGGLDGRFLKPFLERDCSCYLVDFNQKPYPGVERIGSTLDDIPAGTLFDILICSHVLEHVSEPGEFLRQLCSFLAPNGVVYIEVPLEVYEGIAIKTDPVTHINFFTVNSLKNALLLNGHRPLSIKGRFSSYNGKYKRVAWAVSSAAEIKTSLSKVSSINTKRLVNPGALSKLIRGAENYWLKWVLN